MPANLHEDTLPQFLEDYYKDIEEKWKISFCAVDKLPGQALSGHDARFMLFMKSNKVQGLLVYNSEYFQISNQAPMLKINIVHVSGVVNGCTD